MKIARVSDLSRDYGESESEGAHGKGGVENRIARPGQDRTRDEAVLTLFFFSLDVGKTKRKTCPRTT